jgi:hypothetical protein
MISIRCDSCAVEMLMGYVCKKNYVGDNDSERQSWALQQQTPTPTIHICMPCMAKIKRGEVIK